MYKIDFALEFVDMHYDQFLRNYAPDYPIIVDALLAAEDHRGNSHIGIDFRSLARAVLRHIAGRKISGVSTIEQQLARTIYPRTHRNLYFSKLRELILSFQISCRRPKVAIWSAYLMGAYYGTGLHNYHDARALFGTRGVPLSKEQAAAIVSLLKYPRPREPTPRWKLAHTNRVRHVLSRMDAVRANILQDEPN